MPAEEAAAVIWDRMRSYMKEKGGKRATDLFKEIDKDRSGKIDADEFKAALEKMGIEVRLVAARLFSAPLASCSCRHECLMP